MSIRGNWRRSPGLQGGTKWNETGLSKCDEMCRKCVEMRRNESFPGAADLHGNRARNFNEMQRNRSIQAQNRTTGRYFRRGYIFNHPRNVRPVTNSEINLLCWLKTRPWSKASTYTDWITRKGLRYCSPGETLQPHAPRPHTLNEPHRKVCACAKICAEMGFISLLAQ